MAKSAEAFRTISEAADELGVGQHVLRFWETKFSFIRPMKRAGGRRFYRPSDLAVLAGIRRLLHHEGYTIKGVQKLYRENGLKRLAEVEHKSPPFNRLDSGEVSQIQRPDLHMLLRAAISDLDAAKTRLDKTLGLA